MQGDLNCAHPGCPWDYAQPLDLGMADNKLEHFLNITGGHSYAQQEHTWKGKGSHLSLPFCLLELERRIVFNLTRMSCNLCALVICDNSSI